MDERGFTHLLGRRDGRVLTERGIEEVGSALVKDKVGFAISRIELLAFRTTFDVNKLSGLIPVNVSFFTKDVFDRAVDAMKPAFEAGIEAENHGMSTVMEYQRLIKFKELQHARDKNYTLSGRERGAGSKGGKVR